MKTMYGKKVWVSWCSPGAVLSWKDMSSKSKTLRRICAAVLQVDFTNDAVLDVRKSLYIKHESSTIRDRSLRARGASIMSAHNQSKGKTFT